MRIGTAGWSIPSAAAVLAPGEGPHLQRCARILNCAEINSSFHRSHRAAVYAKWAALTPPDFRFALKLPKTITHEQRLRRARPALEQFLAETSALGARRGPLLVQLPPSFAFEHRPLAAFFALLRARFDGPVVCEARHASWLSRAADRLLVDHQVARVAADPPFAPGLERPGGWRSLLYLRLHGSPRTYWSRYDRERLAAYAATLRESEARERWCIFDNTAGGAAFPNACELRSLVAAG